MSNENLTNNNTASETSKGPQFNIQRIYIKDVSIESPLAPQIFRQEWKPEIDLQIHVDTAKLEEDFYQIVLKITVAAKNAEKTALLIEIQQAGIFFMKGFSTEQMGHMLGAFGPNLLFPYAREFISETAIRSGFPPLYLAPVNFDAIYAEQQRQKHPNGNAANTPVSS